MTRHLSDAHGGQRHRLLMRNTAHAVVLAAALFVAWPVQAADGPAKFVQATTRAGMFKTFLGLIDKAQDADWLNAGPVTVFMPTDGAFAHVAPAQRDAIAALSPDDAKRFVSHFVVPGVSMKSNNIDQDITAEDGTSYNVTWFMGRLSLRDHRGPANGPLAFVVNGDNPAGQGMIDAIDDVLMPTFLDAPMSANAPMAQSAALPTPSVPPSTPPNATNAFSTATPVPGPTAVPPATPTNTATIAPGDVPFSESRPTQPAPSPQPIPLAPSIAPSVTTAPTKPDLNITSSDLRGWPVRTIGNGPSGRIDRVVVGVPSGRITGLMATFGGFFGIGGRHVFIAWPFVTVDPRGKAIRVRMTAADLKSAPSNPPTP